MLKIFKFIIIIIFLSTNAIAGSDGKLELSKKSKPIKDCFEPLNRATFSLNQGLDKAFFKPIAKGYRNLPSPIKNGTGNVLDNLSNLITIPNNVLQGDFKLAVVNTGRLVINSTVGILGIIDVANDLGFPKYEKEDYGTAGSFVNVMGGDPWYNASVNGNNEYLSESIYTASKILTGVEFRANNIDSLDNLEKNSIDFYASVKSLYLQDRQMKIKNIQRGNIQIIYNDDGDWEEIDTK